MHQKTTLDNGLRVITTNMSDTRSVAVFFFIGIGSRYESDKLAGSSHFIEHVLFRGTPKRPTSKDIAVAIEGVGGIINGGTDKELTVYWAKVTRPHFELALDVLGDAVLHAKFDPDDVEKERQVIIEEINMSIDQPSQQVSMLFDEILWAGHPLGRDVAGSKETVGAMTRDMLFDCFEKVYLPSNTVVSVAGNIQHEEVVEAVEKTTGSWKKRKPRPVYQLYKEKENSRLIIESRSCEQAHLCLGLPGLSIVDSRRYALDLLNIIFGEGMSSRLFTEIRDKLGLAYSIHSYVDHFLDSGSLIVYAGVDPANLKVTIKAIIEQLARLKETVTEEDLSKAKESSKGRFLLQMEESRALAGWVGGQESLIGKVREIEQALALIDAVTLDDLNGLTRDLIIADKLRLAVVGPLDKDEPLDKLLKL